MIALNTFKKEHDDYQESWLLQMSDTALEPDVLEQ